MGRRWPAWLALAAIAFGGASAAAESTPEAVFDWFEYRGDDGAEADFPAGPDDYRNPILQGFYPDPSITRVGDTYYLVTSTFAYFPGIPVFRSRDLVNWTQIGHAIDRPDQLDFGRLGLSRGVFAPAIEHHDGTFYILNTCVDCGGNFVITARDPAGPWSDPVWLPDLEGGIDPSLFFDTDGRAWILNNGPPEGSPRYDGHRAIWIQAFDPATLRTVGARRILVDGGVDPSTNPVWIEGPHIFRRGEYYYLTAAEGGTEEGHSQVVLRSRSVDGPYEPFPGNPILTQRDLAPDRPHPITSAGHADLVETRNGEYWATFLAVRPYRDGHFNTGRETFLLPVRWEDGWPRITAAGETIPYVHPRPDLPREAGPPAPTSGAFTLRDEFDGASLPFHWVMMRNPRSPWYRLDSGKLRVTARPVALGDYGNPSFLARRQQHIAASATTSLSFLPDRDGASAGIAALQSDDYWYSLGISREDGRNLVQLRRRAGPNEPTTGSVIAAEPLPGPPGEPIQLKIEADGARYRFAFAGVDGRWRNLGGDQDGTLLSTRTAGGFIGAMFGLFAHAPAEGDEGSSIAIRLNQVGLLLDAPKRALLASDSSTPIHWQLIEGSGGVRAGGETRVIGQDEASGESLHLIDFSEFDAPGDAYRLAAGDATSRVFRIAPDIYERLPFDALAYFYHSRVSTPIEARFAGGERWARPAGHAPDTATCVSGPDPQGNVWPGCDYTLDVSRGWYDAGDHGKYLVNGGITVWTLMNAHERQLHLGRPPLFADGTAALPEAGNGVDDLLDEARWEMEFLLAMQVPDGTRLSLPVGARRPGPNLTFTEIDASGLAHHKVADERWTPLPTPPHLDRERRYLHPPTTGATLNLAATAAQCARIWRRIDPAFADRCLAAARRAWDAARRHPDLHAVAGFTGSGGYPAGDLDDEFFWAAAELYAATGGREYAEALRSSPHFTAAISEAGWPRTATLGAITLALVPNGLGAEEIEGIRERIVAAADRFLGESRQVGYHIPYAPPYPWGSTAVLLNRAMLIALAHDFTGEARYRDGVVDSMDYLLGRNPLDRSFVSGYGARPMLHPHHRFWAAAADPSLPPPPPGALSGGPNNSAMSDEVARELRGRCAPMTCWRDDLRAFSLNEVAINWNAPLVWVAAWLAEPR